VTPRDLGTFTGRCAEFCGLDHAKMTFDVKVVSFAEYQSWVSEQQARVRGGAS
jgi:cytochrome c oxidase subunit 2